MFSWLSFARLLISHLCVATWQIDVVDQWWSIIIDLMVRLTSIYCGISRIFSSLTNCAVGILHVSKSAVKTAESGGGGGGNGGGADPSEGVTRWWIT